MKLENEFTVPVDVDTVYQALNDPERVTPCFPGATLDSLDGDDFTGTVKVKLGPVSMTYKGKGTFVERDATNHKVVVDAQGRDSRGNGTASAKATLTMADQGGGSTKVTVLTEMQVTGKPAQFGRGVMSDVGDKILGQFASCLAEEFSDAAPSAAPAAAQPVGAAAGAGSNGAGTASTVSGERRTTGGAGAVVAGAGRPEPMPMATTVAAASAASSGATPGASAAAPENAPIKPVDPAAAPSRPAAPAAAPRPRPQQDDAIDLLGSSREAVLKRLVPVGAAAGVLAALVALIVVLRGRSS